MPKFTEKQIELILSFLGYKLFRVGYVGQEIGFSDDETEFQRENRDWLDRLEIDEVGDYAFKPGVLHKKSIDEKWNDVLKFSQDWNWLLAIASKVGLCMLLTNRSKAIAMIKNALRKRGVIR